MSAQNTKRSGVLGALAGFIGFSVLAGVLVTAMITPALAVTSVAANGTIGIFDNLPDYIRLGAQSQQNSIFANRAGVPEKIATVYDQNREEVTWDQVSPLLRNALVAGEDRRFYDHGGVDLQALVRAGLGYVTKTGSTGGSTLAMQLVKNIRVQQALQEDTPAKVTAAYKDAIATTPTRKLQEMKLAISLEKSYSKKQVLLGYLNIVGMGHNTYGVQAAAQQYYGVTAKDVTLPQAASLIAIVQAPNDLNLSNPKNYPANKQRRDFILDNMLQLKYISQADHDAAVKTPIASYVKLNPPTNGCLNATDAKFFCDFVVRNVPNLTALGSSPAQRQENWKRGGYKIYTSLDLDQQDVTQAQINATTPNTETRFNLGSAAVAVQPGTGKILVMAQNKDFNNTKDGAGSTATAVNFSTDKAYGQSGGFQVGSTYKIFTLTDWLKNGHGLQERVDGTPKTLAQNSFTACGAPAGVGTFQARNDSGGEGGVRSVLSATALSVNVAFFTMAQKLDLCDIRDDAKAMGVHPASGGELDTNPASVLGTNNIAPLTMAAAIATIAANGMYCKPTAIDKIIGPDGKELAGQAKECSQNIDPAIAATTAFALKSVFAPGGTAANYRIPRTPEIMGKTGTSDNSYQNWLIGATTKVALAVWVGNIKGVAAKVTPKNLGGEQSLRQISFAGGSGYNAKFTIFRTAITSLNSNPAYQGGAFPEPDPTLVTGRKVAVPNVVGQSSAQAKSLLESLGFTYADGGPEASSLTAGVVSRTDPGAGSPSTVGQTVTVYTSDGSLSKLPDAVGDHHNNFNQAKQILTSAGWTNVSQSCQVVTNPSEDGKVVASNPAAGTDVAKSTEVKLAVGSLTPCPPGP